MMALILFIGTHGEKYEVMMVKKIRNRNSLQKLIVGIVLLMALIIGGILLFVKETVVSLNEDVTINAENYLELYNRNLEYDINSCDTIFEVLLYNNKDYNMLHSKVEHDRYMASINLKNTIDVLMAYNNVADAVVVSQGTYDINVEGRKASTTYEALEEIKKYNMKLAGGQPQKAAWKSITINNVPYLCKVYTWQNTAVGIYVKVDTLINQESDNSMENIQVVLVDNDVCLGSRGENLVDCKAGDVMDDTSSHRQIVIEKNLSVGNLKTYMYVDLKYSYSNISSTLIIVFAILIVALFVAIWLTYFLRSKVTSEFYEKQIEMSQTELRAIKLALRPHFFLNALTTISSLSVQGENQKIQTYIDALSKNVRYMFKSGLHTVTLEEELRHVENYFAMQDLKYPGAVFYFIECPEEVKQWKVPQMIIHTIIENEFKYGISSDRLLTILIKASIVNTDDENRLLIEIQDDGQGYPEEIIEEFTNGDSINHDTSEGLKKDGKRVGLASIKRMLSIMYEDDKLFELTNIKPHGAMSRIYIPMEPKNEIKD